MSTTCQEVFTGSLKVTGLSSLAPIDVSVLDLFSHRRKAILRLHGTKELAIFSSLDIEKRSEL